MFDAQQVSLVLLLAPVAMAAVGDGGRVNTFENPKLKVFSGADVEYITTWQEAKDFCRSLPYHKWLAHSSEICSNKRHPTNENMVTGLKPDDQWVPIRNRGQRNHWLQIGHLNNGTSIRGTCQTYRDINGIPSPQEQLAALSTKPEPIIYCQKPEGCTGNQCVFECPHKKGYYPDPTDCRSYCYCSGGGDEPSFWETVTGNGLVWDPYCANSNSLAKTNIPLTGMTGGCPRQEHYIKANTYCTLLGESRKERRDLAMKAGDSQQQLSLRGGSSGIGGRELEGQEYQFDYDNRPDWGYLPDKYYGETNSLVCTALPKAPELPQTCASMWGDPHIVTFDGLKYDVQGTGEYVLTKSLDSKLKLQVGMDRFGDKALQATVARKVVLRTPDDSEPKLEVRYFDILNKRCRLQYLLDGKAVNMDGAWLRHGSLASGTEKVQFYVSRHDRYFFFPGSKISLHIRKKHSDAMGCYMNLKICLPDEIVKDEKIVGLLGSPNGDASDDWMDPQGNNLDHQDKVDWAQGFNYGTKTWCCKEEADSLFGSPMKCNPKECCDEEYNDDLERAVMGAPEELRSVCGFDLDCLTDGTAGGISDSTDTVRELKEVYGVEVSPEEKETDPDTEEEDEVFEETSVKPAPEAPPQEEDTCPPRQPIPGSTCSFTDECYYGKETCCGVTHSRFTANCFQAKVVAYYNDACLNPECERCPEKQPQPSDVCFFTGNCDYGEQTCCGQTHPNYIAVCSDGSVVLQANDACMNPKCDIVASSHGDPHFKTFGGERYDYHGECDLVLLQHPHFANGLGLDIQIRTKIDGWMSYIKAAVIRIGDNTLEVMGGKEFTTHWTNGVAAVDLHDGEEATFLGDFLFSVHKIKEYQVHFRVDLGDGDAISIESYKKYVRVNVKPKTDKFNGSIGMLGSYPDGRKVGRDGETLVDDPNSFGQEWQVNASEPMLFHTAEGTVQHPSKCSLPNSSIKRRLGESTMSEAAAREACDGKIDPEECMFDVLSTGDKDIAGTYPVSLG